MIPATRAPRADRRIWAQHIGGLLLSALLLSALPGAAGAQAPAPGAPPPDTIATLETRAGTGDVAAQLALAQRYDTGDGVVQNFARAADWYARAAEAGDAVAQNRLGQLRFAGLGGAIDRAAALELLRAAAAQGAAQHKLDLARVLDAAAPDEAAALYAEAAEAGLAEAQVSLGLLYQEGRGVARDAGRARALYEAAVQQGHPRAQNNLGLLYVRGDGVVQDYTRAAELFAAAAGAGLKPALTNLGVMYENGFGVPQSDAEAARLYRLAGQSGQPGQAGQLAPGAGDGPDAGTDTRPDTGIAIGTGALIYDARLAPPAPGPALEAAAAAGDPVASFQLGWWLAADDAPHADLQRAVALFRQAARAGHGPAMVNLGLMHAAGRGVAQDYVLGQMWLLRADRQGAPGAPALSAALQARMTPGQINAAQARASDESSDEASAGTGAGD